MSYIKRDDVPARAGEVVVELDEGDGLVAVSCERALAGDRLVCHVVARAIDVDGSPRLDGAGHAIERQFRHSAPVGGDAEAVARDCLLAALGEPPVSLPLPPLALASYSIRVAIRAADVAGPVDAGAVL